MPNKVVITNFLKVAKIVNVMNLRNFMKKKNSCLEIEILSFFFFLSLFLLSSLFFSWFLLSAIIRATMR